MTDSKAAQAARMAALDFFSRYRAGVIPKEAWDEALRILEQDGDCQLLAVLLWRATPNRDGTTPLPTDVVYKLARIFMGTPFERARLKKKTDTSRTRKAALDHEQSVKEMLDLVTERRSKLQPKPSRRNLGFLRTR